jgi:mRNA-degrading endonuclease RelE of RelBE toxin-antitoxin system
VRFRATPAFERDWRRLSDRERVLFRAAVREDFHPACERRHGKPTSAFPKKIRVKPVAGAPGIWEMTWRFAERMPNDV